MRSRIKDLRAEHAEHLSTKRHEALEAQDLMSRPVALKVAAEREKGGLIIVSAQYGLASAFTDRGVRSARAARAYKSEDEKSASGLNGHGNVRADRAGQDQEQEQEQEEGEEEEVVADVTISVQNLVVDSRLCIPNGRSKVCSTSFCTLISLA